MVTSLVYSAVFLSVVSYARLNAGRWLVAYFALVPWFGLQTNIGLTINVDRFVALVLLARLLARRGVGAFRPFGAFLAYGAAVTLAYGLTLPSSVSALPPLQGQWRWLLQIPMWSLALGAYACWEEPAVLRAAMRAFTWSCGVLAILGIAQFGVQRVTGIDILPIGALDAAMEVRSGMFDSDSLFLGGGQMFRISSLGGEPKHLAYTLVVALSLLLVDYLHGGVLGLRRRQALPIGAVMALALLLTFSTQGLALGALNVAALIVVGAFTGRAQVRSIVLAASLLAVATVLVGAVPGLSDVLRARVFDRIAEGGFIEDFNATILMWLRAAPAYAVTGVGWGNVHVFAASYVPGEFAHYMTGTVFVAKSGLLRIVSEVGVIGLGLFVASIMVALRRLAVARPEGWRALLCFVALLAVDFAVSSDAPPYLYLFTGVAYGAGAVGGSPLEPDVTEVDEVRSCG